MQPSFPYIVSCDSLDTSHGVYLRAAFMSVFVVHPEAII